MINIKLKRHTNKITNNEYKIERHESNTKINNIVGNLRTECLP